MQISSCWYVGENSAGMGVVVLEGCPGFRIGKGCGSSFGFNNAVSELV
jgi:hypothetical protein